MSAGITVSPGDEVNIEVDGTRRTERLGARIGLGGAGAVFELPNSAKFVAKIYVMQTPDGLNVDSAAAKRNHPRIEAMIRQPPKIGTPHKDSSGRLFPQLAWPTGHVLNLRGARLGFIMPKIPTTAACDLEAILTSVGRSAEKISQSYALRVYVARNLAVLMKELHQERHFVVDMKPKNFSVYKTGAPGLIAMLDTDGFSIHAGRGKRFAAEMVSSEYMAPELLHNRRKTSDAGEDEDRWALAVILFRLLNEGVHPYSGIAKSGAAQTIDENVASGRYAYGVVSNPMAQPNPLSLHEYFAPKTREMFDLAFGPNAAQRPSAKQWSDHLSSFEAGKRGGIRQCRKNTDHWYFDRACGLCARDKKKNQPKAKSQQWTLPPNVVGKTRRQSRAPAPAPAPKRAYVPTPAAAPQNNSTIEPHPPRRSAIVALGSSLLVGTWFYLVVLVPNQSESVGAINNTSQPRPTPNNQTENLRPKNMVDDGYAGKLRGIIRAKINFPIPVGMRNNPRADFTIKLSDDGTTESIEMTRGSGLEEWDRAAMRGLSRVGRFPCNSHGKCPPSIIISLRPR